MEQEENLLKSLCAFLMFTYRQLKAVCEVFVLARIALPRELILKLKNALLDTPPCTWRLPDGLT